MKITDNVYFFPETGMMDSNTCVIKDEITVLIDPGLDRYMEGLIKAMKEDDIDISDVDIIINTHLHLDHYWACEDMKKLSNAKILMHPLQKEHYEVTVVGVSKVFSMPPVHIKEDEILDGKLNTGKLEFDMIVSPGHSPDSICFYNNDQKVVIGGDVIFAGNTGRVDFPGGGGAMLKESIEGLAKLDIDHLMPGHMGMVSGKDNVQRNFDFVRNNVFQWL